MGGSLTCTRETPAIFDECFILDTFFRFPYHTYFYSAAQIFLLSCNSVPPCIPNTGVGSGRSSSSFAVAFCLRPYGGASGGGVGVLGTNASARGDGVETIAMEAVIQQRPLSVMARTAVPLVSIAAEAAPPPIGFLSPSPALLSLSFLSRARSRCLPRKTSCESTCPVPRRLEKPL